MTAQWIIDAEVSDCKRCLTCEKKLSKKELLNIDFDGWAFCNDHMGKFAAYIENNEPELVMKDGFSSIDEANDWVIEHIEEEVYEDVQEWTVIKVG